MKILDNKKDYYDYLMGIYGIDEKVFYDRRGSKTLDYVLQRNCMTKEEYEKYITHMILRVGNTEYTFDRDKDGKWYMPQETYDGSWWNHEVYKNPRILSDEQIELRKDKDVPIVLEVYIRNPRTSYWGSNVATVENPILQTFGIIPRFIPAEKIWEHVYDFISHKNDKKIVDNRTDIEKLESHGFDKHSSFRNVK